MSEQEFESYLRLLSRFLRLSEGQRESIRCELRDHMQERLEELLASGMKRDEAIAAALDEFGDAAALAHDFDRIGRRRKWIMRSTIGALGLTCFVLIVSSVLPPRSGSAPLLGVAAEPGRPTSRPAHAATPPPIALPSLTRDQRAEEAARKKLETPVKGMAFEASPFREVLNYLEQTGGIVLSVNWKALEVVGISPDTEVIAKLPDTSLGTALRIVLDSVSDPGCGAADYALVDGAIRVSSSDDLNRYTAIRVYDCRDLIQRPLTADQRKALESVIRGESAAPPLRGGGGMMGGGFGGGGGMEPGAAGGFGGGGGAPQEQKDDPSLSPFEQAVVRIMDALRKRDAQDLVDLIKTTVEPGTWQPDACGVGSISEFDGLLVVRHNARTQERLSELLAMLRDARAARSRTAMESERTATSLAR